MRRLGLRVGLAANPDTPFEALEPYLDQVDLVLCMTVFPGFGGQEFMAEVMDKVARVRRALDERGLDGRTSRWTGDRRDDGAAGRRGRGQRLRGRVGRFRPRAPWEAAEAIREAALRLRRPPGPRPAAEPAQEGRRSTVWCPCVDGF